MVLENSIEDQLIKAEKCETEDLPRLNVSELDYGKAGNYTIQVPPTGSFKQDLGNRPSCCILNAETLFQSTKVTVKNNMEQEEVKNEVIEPIEEKEFQPEFATEFVKAEPFEIKTVNGIFLDSVEPKEFDSNYQIQVKFANEAITCNECNFRTDSHTYLLLHIRHVHTQVFSDVVTSEFTKQNHKNVINTCNICRMTFTSVLKLQSHTRKHNLNRPILNCFHCNYTTSNKSILGRHMLLHVGFYRSTTDTKISLKVEGKTNLQKCAQCQYFALTQTGLLTHTAQVHGTNAKTIVCTLCSRLFTHEKFLNRHIVRVHAFQLLHCADCTFTTKYKKTLEEHIAVHKGVFNYNCTFCSYKTAKSQSFSRHLQKHRQLKPYTCEYCSYQCQTKERLIEHNRVHTGEQPFCCDVCGKFYKSQGYLRVHMSTHSTERPFQCNICTFRAKSKRRLVLHKRIHQPKTKFRCMQCDFVTNEKHRLQSHVIKHTAEKNFVCNVCTFRTSHRLSYTRHMNRHFTIKVFNCPDCAYSTTHDGNFGMHRKRHLGIGSMTCDRCSYTTTHRSNFKHHVTKTCSILKSET